MIAKAAIAAALLCHSVLTIAGADQPWNEDRSPVNVGAFFVVGVVFFILHLIEKGELADFFKTAARGLKFLSLFYLIPYGWLVIFYLIGKLLGGSVIAGLIALPVSAYLTFKVFMFATPGKRKEAEQASGKSES